MIKTQQHTRRELQVTFTIRATFECENCGRTMVLDDEIYCSDSTGEEAAWVFGGSKAAANKECDECEEPMRILPLRADSVIDLTPYQGVDDPAPATAAGRE